MAEFRYIAASRTGEATRGTMDAADEAEVTARLQHDGHIVLHVRPEAGRSLGDLLSFEMGRGPALSKQDVADLTRELSLMLGAGQDLDRALRFLVETAPRPRVRAVLEQIRDAVRGGAALATALGQHPRSFPRLYIGLVRAGEVGGTLAATLEQLADLLERERALAANITSAMIYPALLLVAAIASIAVLLTQVLPQFVPLFEQNGVALPGPTRALIALGAVVSDYGAYAALLAGATFLLVRQALRHPGWRIRADRLLLRLPVFGALVREVLAARFTRTLGTLLNNGVPLMGAMAVVRDTMSNFATIAAVDKAMLEVKAGASLARSLGAAGVFPARTIHLLQLGEETKLGALAVRAAAIHEEKSRVGLQRVVSLLVPVITILMGAAVAGIVSALLLAMLSLNDLAT